MMMKKKEILQSLLKLVVIVFAATVLGKIFTGSWISRNDML